MTVSQKQLEANRKNAPEGGVKTPEGKAIAKYNALKHGLLAKEVVVTVGEGAEDPTEFAALSQKLVSQFQPQGTVEEMLVEKIAVAYWRLRRAYRYEAGLIRLELETAAEKYYGKYRSDGEKKHRTDEQIDAEIAKEREAVAYWRKDKNDLSRMHKEGAPLEGIYEWKENWELLQEKVNDLLPEDLDDEDDFGPKELQECLNKDANWSDDDIWKALIDDCAERVAQHQGQIEALEREKEKNQQRIEVLKVLGNIPSRDELDRLLRYEGAIERQFYKALNQLERLQRLRAGDNVPAPIQVDVDVNTGETA
jgi:hypothetical protein